MDDLRIARLARDLGDEDLAGRLVAARRQVVKAVPQDVSRRHLATIVAAATATGATMAGAAAAGAAAGGSTSITSVNGAGGATTALAAGTAAGTGTGIGLGPTIAALAAAGALVGGGLAVSGQLPEPVQRVVAELGGRIGLDLPNGAAAADEQPGHSGEAPGRDPERDPPGQTGTDGPPGLEQRAETPGAGVVEGTPGSDARDRVPGQTEQLPTLPQRDTTPTVPDPGGTDASGDVDEPGRGSLPPAVPEPVAPEPEAGDDASTNNRRVDVPREPGVGTEDPPARPDRADESSARRDDG